MLLRSKSFSEKTGLIKDVVAAGKGTKDGKDAWVDGAVTREGKAGRDRNENHFIKEETRYEDSNWRAQVTLLFTNILMNYNMTGLRKKLNLTVDFKSKGLGSQKQVSEPSVPKKGVW